MSKTRTKSTDRPLEHLEIDNLETLRVLTDPLRLEIIQSLMTPSTVKSLAQALNVAPTKLYYHMNLLEQHGIVRVVSTRVVSGIIEKQYGLTAYSFGAKPGLVSAQGGDADAALALHDGILESARLELRRAYNADLIGPSNEAVSDGARRTVSVGKLNGTFTEKQAHEFRKRLEKLLKELSEEQRTPDEKSQKADVYAFTFAFHRTVDPRPKTAGKPSHKTQATKSRAVKPAPKPQSRGAK
jgi:DNA-binding transcriptional ArsR family regulator